MRRALLRSGFLIFRLKAGAIIFVLAAGSKKAVCRHSGTFRAMRAMKFSAARSANTNSGFRMCDREFFPKVALTSIRF